MLLIIESEKTEKIEEVDVEAGDAAARAAAGEAGWDGERRRQGGRGGCACVGVRARAWGTRASEASGTNLSPRFWPK